MNGLGRATGPRAGADRRSWPAARFRARSGATGERLAAPRHRRARSCAGRASKPSTGIQQAAREARYRLLFEACRRHGILHLLMAHHADDQAETLAMRAARESGPDGLAGMAALVEHRDAAPAAAAARRAAGAADRDPAGARGSAGSTIRRTTTAASSGSGCARMAAHRHRRRTGGRGRRGTGGSPRRRCETLEVGPRGRRPGSTGRVGFGRRKLQARLLSRVVQAVGGGDYPPRRERLERAAARLSPGRRSRRQIGKKPGFHAIRLPADAAARPGHPAAALDCPARKWQEERQTRASPSSRQHFSLAARPPRPI